MLKDGLRSEESRHGQLQCELVASIDCVNMLRMWYNQVWAGIYTQFLRRIYVVH